MGTPFDARACVESTVCILINGLLLPAIHLAHDWV